MTDERREISRLDNVLVEQEGHIRIFTLNRPERMNALSGEMLTRLGQLFREAGEDSSVRVIVMTGAGDAFCAGADVGHIKNLAQKATDHVHAMPQFTARHCKVYKPTICAVNGMCASAGLHFVADSDIVIASERAKFTDTHVNVGQVTAIEPIGLARRAPMSAVLRMLILGRAERLDAQQALAAQLVSEVVPPDQLMDRAMTLARLAGKVSPAAVQTSLKAFWEAFELPLEEAYDRGWTDLVRHRQHPDAAEGPAAFNEKREPVWRDQ